MFLSAWYYSRIPGRNVQLTRGVRICGWRTHRREAVTTCTTLHHTAVQYTVQAATTSRTKTSYGEDEDWKKQICARLAGHVL